MICVVLHREHRGDRYVLVCYSMLYVCVRGVMDVFVCIVTRGAVGVRVWEL